MKAQLEDSEANIPMGVSMTSEVDWIAAAVSKARQQSRAVPERVWIELEALLRGKFSERSIPPMDLASIATRLIGDMVLELAADRDKQ